MRPKYDLRSFVVYSMEKLLFEDAILGNSSIFYYDSFYIYIIRIFTVVACLLPSEYVVHSCVFVERYTAAKICIKLIIENELSETV
ncbi:unnamed protein product [Adineta ricciae]|uniref:Uncharacterized protein n=1 Tax=Adineta ricciae TaxID=249248 RepID=A0A814FUN9_ADIRI|nr:unnamed protein product [Adineta ricciae]